MSAAAQKVDVLAVMDDEISSLPQMAVWAGSDASEAIERMKSARVAVAELIEAGWLISRHAEPSEWMRFHEALARIGSAA